MKKKSDDSARDNRANQLNPTHPAYHRARGASPTEARQLAETSKPVLDNRADQLNPNNPRYLGGRAGSSTASDVASTDSASVKPE